jgi:hypothetical protein
VFLGLVRKSRFSWNGQPCDDLEEKDMINILFDKEGKEGPSLHSHTAFQLSKKSGRSQSLLPIWAKSQ